MAETKTNGTGPAAPSKMDAVREALRKLGRDAKAAAVQKWVKNTYGLEMSVNYVYTCLSEIRKGGKEAGASRAPAPAKKPAAASVKPPAPRSVPVASPPTSARPVAGGGINLEDIAAVKAPLGRVGPEKLRGLIDLLAE